jgi:hypothetical protein
MSSAPASEPLPSTARSSRAALASVALRPVAIASTVEYATTPAMPTQITKMC